jgi:hypothetical protein
MSNLRGVVQSDLTLIQRISKFLKSHTGEVYSKIWIFQPFSVAKIEGRAKFCKFHPPIPLTPSKNFKNLH